MLHYLGLVLVTFSWLIGAIILIRWHDQNLLTISKHAATSRNSLLLFAGGMSLIGAGFYWWLVGWLQPHIQPAGIFTACASLTTLSLILTALFPDLPGWRRKVHVSAAYTMAVSYVPLAIVISAAHLSHIAHLLCSLLIVYMFVTFIIFVLYKKARQHYLIFQVLYIVAFELVIVFAGYLS